MRTASTPHLRNRRRIHDNTTTSQSRSDWTKRNERLCFPPPRIFCILVHNERVDAIFQINPDAHGEWQDPYSTMLKSLSFAISPRQTCARYIREVRIRGAPYVNVYEIEIIENNLHCNYKLHCKFLNKFFNCMLISYETSMPSYTLIVSETMYSMHSCYLDRLIWKRISPLFVNLRKVNLIIFVIAISDYLKSF